MQKQKEQAQAQANPFSEMEKEVLNFWEENKIFEKSVEREAPKGDYVFYDGPPFATGTPHYGHIVGSIMKDVVPRFWTMQGYRVERKWGWDCHGLPIENIVEKEFGSKAKKDIEAMGVEKFNELCRSKVLGYVDEWEAVIRRLGRWADMKNAYKTMDLNYMESIWWVFKELYDKGLVYEGYRSMHICPRCETTLSQQEVAEGYKDIKDLSAIVKFKIKNFKEVFKITNEAYLLAWTTTPWTLIGNVALAVGKKEKGITYKLIFIKLDMSAKVSRGGNYASREVSFLEEEDKFNKEHKGKAYLVSSTFDATKYFKFPVREEILLKDIPEEQLVRLEYEPLFDYYLKVEKLGSRENGWKVYAADFVTTEDGTGVVHIAPAFGEDDMNLGKQENLPFIQHVGMDGVIKPEAKDFAGLNVKPAGDHMSTDIEIIKYLAYNNLLFAKEKYEHSYPHCWRCDTPLINYATSSWFVGITKIKNKLLETAKEINWSPEHIKEGRFGKWLEGARDWSISRQRFWASVMPIWVCDKCEEKKVLGSVKELEDLSGEKVTDLHKHIVDKITFPCKCGPSTSSGQAGTMKRVPDVLDTWFDSGSMPYAQMHYPFENKEKFEKNFPAEFIAEGVDQSRAWFYYMHSIAGGIKGKRAFNNVIVNGIVLAEDGKKMSKRLNNYPDPSFIFDKYGADSLRYYLLTSPVMIAENLNFSEKGVQESLRNVIMILWNVYKFYEMYAEPSEYTNHQDNYIKEVLSINSSNILDKWILAKLNQLVREVTDNMNNYNLPKASRPIEDFINDLSTWYLRRSRDRFKGEDEKDKQAALSTTRFVLLELAKVMAPFMPFVAENLWQKVTGNNFQDGNKSVHLEEWPSFAKATEGKPEEIVEEMEKARKLTEQILSARDERQFKIRQPLGEAIISIKLGDEYKKIVEDECNVWKITEGDINELPSHGIWRKFGDSLAVNFEITPELKLEGNRRELVRLINALRKQADMTIKDKAVIYYETESVEIREAFEKLEKEILKDTLSDKIIGNTSDTEIKREVKINSETVVLGIKKL